MGGGRNAAGDAEVAMPAAAAAGPVPKGLFDVVGATKWRDNSAAQGVVLEGRGLALEEAADYADTCTDCAHAVEDWEGLLLLVLLYTPWCRMGSCLTGTRPWSRPGGGASPLQPGPWTGRPDPGAAHWQGRGSVGGAGWGADGGRGGLALSLGAGVPNGRAGGGQQRASPLQPGHTVDRAAGPGIEDYSRSPGR